MDGQDPAGVECGSAPRTSQLGTRLGPGPGCAGDFFRRYRSLVSDHRRQPGVPLLRLAAIALWSAAAYRLVPECAGFPPLHPNLYVQLVSRLSLLEHAVSR